jgi:hypothetical protein
MTDDALVEVVSAFAADDLEEARRRARSASDSGDDLAQAMASYLERVATQGATGVYASPEGFTAFIRGGGNRRLYRAVTAGLREIYGELPRPFALADVGCGDGLALVPSVEGVGVGVGVGVDVDAAITAIEPSGALLAAAVRALEAAGARFESFEMSIEAFIAQHGERRFDLIQSTFALHNLPREPRREVLAWARGAAPALAIVEFDALPVDARDPAYIAHVLGRYRRGIAEYDADELVVQGFLMPVMFGYFASGRARITYEQPAAAWDADLAAAGFGTVRSSVIDDYWWAPAVLLRAA